MTGTYKLEIPLLNELTTICTLVTSFNSVLPIIQQRIGLGCVANEMNNSFMYPTSVDVLRGNVGINENKLIMVQIAMERSIFLVRIIGFANKLKSEK